MPGPPQPFQCLCFQLQLAQLPALEVQDPVQHHQCQPTKVLQKHLSQGNPLQAVPVLYLLQELQFHCPQLYLLHMALLNQQSYKVFTHHQGLRSQLPFIDTTHLLPQQNNQVVENLLLLLASQQDLIDHLCPLNLQIPQASIQQKSLLNQLPRRGHPQSLP